MIKRRVKMKITPELLPLIEWWEKEGKQTLTFVAIAVAAVGAFYGYRSYNANKEASASKAFVSSQLVDDLEAANDAYGSTKAANAIKMKLAKSYFDQGKYSEAKAIYEALAKTPAAGFDEVGAIGIAACLEADGAYAEAAKCFDALQEEKPASFLALNAQLGAARCYALAGDKAKALSRLNAIKAANKGKEDIVARVDAALDLVNRLGKEAAQPVVAEEKKEEASPAADEKPAEKADASAAEKKDAAPAKAK